MENHQGAVVADGVVGSQKRKHQCWSLRVMRAFASCAAVEQQSQTKTTTQKGGRSALQCESSWRFLRLSRDRRSWRWRKEKRKRKQQRRKRFGRDERHQGDEDVSWNLTCTGRR